MSKFSFKPVYHTALCIIPPKGEWSQIQEIRKKHDRAFKRWFPHFNFLFPFFDLPHFDTVGKAFEKELAEIKPFEVSLSKFDHFTHSKKCVLLLAPEDNSPFKRVFGILSKLCPNLVKRPDFKPHLTCGQFSSREIVKREKEFQKGFKKIKFVAEGLSMIHRDGKDQPFKVVRMVRFGKGVGKKDTLEEVKVVEMEEEEEGVKEEVVVKEKEDEKAPWGAVEEKEPEEPASLPERIKKQMEYYFSDANLERDYFLQKQISKSGRCKFFLLSDNQIGVDLSVILKFNKMKAMGCSANDIKSALRNSSLEVQKGQVRRKRAYVNYGSSEYLYRTVVVRGFKRNAGAKRAKKFLERTIQTGKLSIRGRYRNMKYSKRNFLGDVFVTFTSEEEESAFFSKCQGGNKLFSDDKEKLYVLPILVFRKRKRDPEIEMTAKFEFAQGFGKNMKSVYSIGRGGRGRGGRIGRYRGGGRGSYSGAAMRGRVSRGRAPRRRMGRAKLVPTEEKRKKSKRKSKFEKEYNKGVDFDDYDPIWGGYTKKKERRGRF